MVWENLGKVERKRMTKSEERFLMILKDAFHPGEGIPSCTELPAIGDFTDWKSIFDTARKQNLFPLIYDAATTYPSFAGFGQVCPQYFTAATASMAVQMRKNTDFLALYKAFLDVDLAPVTVKGIICRELYGEKADFRPSGDEDLLIEKKDYEKMVSVLEACGYHSSLQLDRAQSVPQEITFYGENLTIELHLSPFGMEKMNAWFRDVFQRSETLEVKGIPAKHYCHPPDLGAGHPRPATVSLSYDHCRDIAGHTVPRRIRHNTANHAS